TMPAPVLVVYASHVSGPLTTAPPSVATFQTKTFAHGGAGYLPPTAYVTTGPFIASEATGPASSFTRGFAGESPADADGSAPATTAPATAATRHVHRRSAKSSLHVGERQEPEPILEVRRPLQRVREPFRREGDLDADPVPLDDRPFLAG